MAYLGDQELKAMGFRSLGSGVKISNKASIYDANQISIGDNSRIDDFCVLAGKVSIGRNVHLAVLCNLAGGREGITLDDFAGLAYGCQVIAQSDDYSGASMTNPTIPSRYKNEVSLPVRIGRHAILGAASIVLPGITIHEGVSSGAGTLFTKETEPWSIYVGSPARRIRARLQGLLELERDYIESAEHETGH